MSAPSHFTAQPTVADCTPSLMLELRSVSAGYDQGFMIRDITFGLSAGEMSSIVGPNGSGKSTLFRTCSGDLEPKRGEVYLEGRPLAHYSVRERAQSMAIVSQFVPVSHITVEEYVVMGRIPHRPRYQFFDSRDDRARAQHYMEVTGVVHLRHRMLSELSGGERQMASVAMALCRDPQLLLLDEPTAHLDISKQVKLLDLVRRLNHDLGLTVLLILHDLSLAAEYCDRLLMMHEGRLVAHGTAEEILTVPRIEQVYDTPVYIGRNPITGHLSVHPLPESRRPRLT